MSTRTRQSSSHRTRSTTSSGGSQPVQANGARAAALNQPTLRRGAKGTAVSQLQQSLASAGFSPGAIDGDFGPATDRALRQFQSARGLAVDGIAGPNTHMALSGSGGSQRRAPAQGGQEGGQQRRPSFLERLFGGGGGNQRQQPRNTSRGFELPNAGFTVPTQQIYGSGVSQAALSTALTAFDTAWARGQTTSTIFTLVDFTKSDDVKRLWVMDLRTGQVLHNEFVGHGDGGRAGYHEHAPDFSNEHGSRLSSLGLMRAVGSGQTSSGAGRVGTPVQRFQGLERGFNDNVYGRNVIMHQAKNSHGTYVDNRGVHGNSFGCWVMEPGANDRVVATIPAGGLLFNYFPDRRYMENSSYLRRMLQG